MKPLHLGLRFQLETAWVHPTTTHASRSSMPRPTTQTTSKEVCALAKDLVCLRLGDHTRGDRRVDRILESGLHTGLEGTVVEQSIMTFHKISLFLGELAIRHRLVDAGKDGSLVTRNEFLDADI